MKLVAKDEKGNIVEVRASYRIHVNTEFGHGEVSIPAVDIYLSTGMPDKNGREIVVGSEVTMPDGLTATVIFDGECFFLLRYSNVVTEALTPELAKTLEVIS